MAGAWYIWIMLGFFTCAAVAIVGFTAMLYVGHWLEKKQTGAKHGFLEKPAETLPPAVPQDLPPTSEDSAPKP